MRLLEFILPFTVKRIDVIFVLSKYGIEVKMIPFIKYINNTFIIFRTDLNTGTGFSANESLFGKASAKFRINRGSSLPAAVFLLTTGQK
jgi:hypothetical protein